MNRFDTNTKGTSPALSQIQADWQKMPRSSFDLTRRKSFDAEPYAIIPFECFPLFPGTDVNLRYDLSVITKNPTVRRMLSSMSAEISVYQVEHNSDLWEGWNNFVTRGRKGNVSLEIPHLDWTLCRAATVPDTSMCTCFPYNPAHYLNIAPACFCGRDVNLFSVAGNSGVHSVNDMQLTGLTGITTVSALVASEAMKVSALPFVAYVKIAKEFQNANMLQDNPHWYPVNEAHDTILPYDAGGKAVSNATYDDCQHSYDYDAQDPVQPTSDDSSYPWLNVLYYKMRRGDYFTTGSPFPDLLRGDIPTLEILNGSVDFSDVVYNPTGASSVISSTPESAVRRLLAITGQRSGEIEGRWYLNPQTVTSGMNVNSPLTDMTDLTSRSKALADMLNRATVKGMQFSMNEWRKLAVETIFRERLARTDGSYNKMIEAMFGHNPRWHNHQVRYCGGSTQQIVFSEVVQTSADNSASPLGTTAGRAVSAQSTGVVRIHSDDFGMFMAVLTLTPDTYYSQGVDRCWSELTESEQYFPIRNNLAPQATLNRELYVSGDNAEDMDVFNYQERYSHFKSRQNQVSGLLSLPISKVGDDGAYIFNRLFDATPQFNQSFVQGSMSDNERLAFASTTQAQFVCSVVSQMHMTAPMPAITEASSMGVSY